MNFKINIFLILLCLNLKGQLNDESKHFWVGFAIPISTHYVIKQFNINPVKSRTISFLTGMVANGLKEIIHDKYLRLGVPSFKDAVFTTYGVSLGTGVNFCIDDTQKRKQLAIDTLYFINLNQK